MWVIWFLFVQVNDTNLHPKLKNKYRKREQEPMIEQLHNVPKTIPKPSRDEMLRVLFERHVSLEKDHAKEFKSFWVTNALDGSENYLISERVYKLVGTRMIDFRNQLMKTASPKNIKQLLKLITPPKGVKWKNAEGSAAPFDEGDELFDCEDGEIKTETIEEDKSTSNEEDEMPQVTSQAAENEENATTEDSSPSKSAQSIPKLALLCPEDKTELLNDAKFIEDGSIVVNLHYFCLDFAIYSRYSMALHIGKTQRERGNSFS